MLNRVHFTKFCAISCLSCKYYPEVGRGPSKIFGFNFPSKSPPLRKQIFYIRGVYCYLVIPAFTVVTTDSELDPIESLWFMARLETASMILCTLHLLTTVKPDTT